MNNYERNKIELRGLLARMLERQASESDLLRINDILRIEPELVDLYLEYMDVSFGLSELTVDDEIVLNEVSESSCDKAMLAELALSEGSNPAIELETAAAIEEVEKPVKTVSYQKFNSRITSLVAMASIAALVVMVIHFVFLQVSTPASVGVLAGVVDARWSKGDLVAGNTLDQGQVLSLQTGLARLVLHSGAELILNGPATVELSSAIGINLKKGKVTVLADDIEAGVFTVHASGYDIIDYGTEFGVSVYGSQVDTHVSQGRVSVQLAGDTKVAVKHDLIAGQAARASVGGGIRQIEYDQRVFVFTDEYISVEKSLRGSQYDKWRTLMYKLQRDDALVAQYFWDENSKAENILLNSAPLTRGRLNGQLGDVGRSIPKWVEGRWGKNNALKFVRSKGDVVVISGDNESKITSPLTIALWAKFPAGSSYGGNFVSCRSGHDVNYQFSFFDNQYSIDYQRERLEFLQFPSDKKQWIYGKGFSPEPEKWYHLALSYDGKIVRYYIDGELSDEKSCSGMVNAVDADIILGAAKVNQDYVSTDGDLNGTMDELFIFNRVLLSDEINEIYLAGVAD